MRWSDIEHTQPRLGGLARQRLIGPGVVLVATIRRDGTEGELKIRGVTRAELDQPIQRRYAQAVAADLGWNPQPGQFHLFAIDISHVTFISYNNATGDQHVAMWRPAREFIRRATSATCVGAPEPVSEIIGVD